MTDKEKLQRLFDAALKDPSEISKPPTRAVPAPVAAIPAAVSETLPEPVAAEVAVTPVGNAGLCDAASAELGALLDEQQQRKSRKRRREALVTFGVMFALAGGGFGWFVQSPQRIQALTEAIRDIRSVGDVASMVAKYQAALDKVAVRSKQIDQATEAMGVSSDQEDEKDPQMEAEMLAMMGGKGKTTGQRNKALQENFGHMKKKHELDGKDPADAPMKEGESFDWKK